MAKSGTLPALDYLKKAPDNDDGAARCVDQAAALVDQFSEQHTLPALNALIAAAERPAQAAIATELNAAALELTAQTETLYREVTRFLTLAPDSETSGRSTD